MPEKSTYTLFDLYDSLPVFAICEGHVNTTEFNKLLRREDFVQRGWVLKKYLSHEYWVFKGGKWKPATKRSKKAIPVTVYRCE